MKSFKKSLVLLPLSLLVLSSVEPVAAKADSWGSAEEANNQKAENNRINNIGVTDKMLESIASANETNIVNYINYEIGIINTDPNVYSNDKTGHIDKLNKYKQEAQQAHDKYNAKIESASNTFTGLSAYYNDYSDSVNDIQFIQMTESQAMIYYHSLQDATYQSSVYPSSNDISEFLMNYKDSQPSVPIDNNPGDIVPNTTQVQSMISSAVSSNNSTDADAKAIASLQAEVAKLEKEVSGQKKSSSHTKILAADKKALAKINKKLHQKHLSKKAHHKLVLQRKALLKAIKKLSK